MNVRCGIVICVVLAFEIGLCLDAAEADLSEKSFLLDRDGGTIEVQVTNSTDRQTRDAIRQQLSGEARNSVPLATAALRQHRREIEYRYENTARGGRIRIIARTGEALMAVQDFLRSHMNGVLGHPRVAFDFVDNTSLVVVPVTINSRGPYRFLLDTGASNTILSSAVADSLGIPDGRRERLLTAGGDVPVSIRTLKTLTVGAAHLEDVEIAVTNVGLMKTLKVDGILGGDYLRRFKVSIDYDNRLVDIEPSLPDLVSWFDA
jgi:predicted aspartyl protease